MANGHKASQRTNLPGSAPRKKRNRLSVDLSKYPDVEQSINEALDCFPRATATQFTIGALRPYLREILKKQKHSKASSKR